MVFWNIFYKESFEVFPMRCFLFIQGNSNFITEMFDGILVRQLWLAAHYLTSILWSHSEMDFKESSGSLSCKNLKQLSLSWVTKSIIFSKEWSCILAIQFPLNFLTFSAPATSRNDEVPRKSVQNFHYSYQQLYYDVDQFFIGSVINWCVHHRTSLIIVLAAAFESFSTRNITGVVST